MSDAALLDGLYLGSTHILTPERFIDDLKALEIEGVGSAALPNGLPTGSSGAGEYQEYYDKRYFTPDAPAPAPVAPPPKTNGGNRPMNAYRDNGGGYGSANARPAAPAPLSTSSLAPPPMQSGEVSAGKLKKKRGLFGF